MISDSQTWYGFARIPGLARQGSRRAWRSYQDSIALRKAPISGLDKAGFAADNIPRVEGFFFKFFDER
jgi:hypothetical protein